MYMCMGMCLLQSGLNLKDLLNGLKTEGHKNLEQ